MTVQFRLGHADHKKVEDFLVTGSHQGTGAIVLDAKAARWQSGAAEAAREADVDVLWEPATERLDAPGFNQEKYPCFNGSLYVVDDLAAQHDLRASLVDRVIAEHPSLVTMVTAPHFYVDDERTAHLNTTLAEMTSLEQEKPVRAVLTVSNRFARTNATMLAAEYARAGIRALELRMSPFGGDDESLRKIRNAYQVLQDFTSAGITVTLGQSGTTGQVAVALGYAASYSVGIGMLERVDHKAVISRQAVKPKPAEDGEGGGPAAGIYLPGIASTLPRRAAIALLEQTDIRGRLGCRIDRCGASIRGPLEDARGHYLHARSNDMAQLLQRPARWRATLEIERLRQAVTLRERINAHYLTDGVSELKTRTIHGLINDLTEHRQAS